MSPPRRRVLYLCTGNSCRSQMAEGLTNALRGDEFEAHSAGVEPGQVDPRAVEAMAETGVDISGQASKDVEAFIGQPWDWVVTLCDNARESCPFSPARWRGCTAASTTRPVWPPGRRTGMRPWLTTAGCAMRSKPWSWIFPPAWRMSHEPA